MANLNGGRVAGCSAAALSLDDDVLIPAVLFGDRATRRAAARNLAKLIKRRKAAAADKPVTRVIHQEPQFDRLRVLKQGGVPVAVFARPRRDVAE